MDSELDCEPSGQGLLELQKAKKTLDDLELKIKSYKKQNQCYKHNTEVEHAFGNHVYPDIHQYLSNLVRDVYAEEEQNDSVYGKHQNGRERPCWSELKNHRNSHLAYGEHGRGQSGSQLQKQPITIPPSLDIRKHTQEQLQKSQIARLEKMQENFNENLSVLESRMAQLQRNKEKIKQDKVLLMRENEELQSQIERLRRKKENKANAINHQPNSGESVLIDELQTLLSKLAKKMAKIELQNSKISQRKKNLETNMRVCMRNNQDLLRGQIMVASMCEKGKCLKKSKSRSAMAASSHPINRNNRCPYH